jgi:hypothetical protein
MPRRAKSEKPPAEALRRRWLKCFINSSVTVLAAEGIENRVAPVQEGADRAGSWLASCPPPLGLSLRAAEPELAASGGGE